MFPATTENFAQLGRENQKQFSQEIELISDSGGSFEWVLGGFFFKESGYERNPQNFLFVMDTNQQVFTTANFGALAPLLQAGNPARYRGVPQFSVLDYNASGESYAVYGQGTYRFGEEEQFGLTFGLGAFMCYILFIIGQLAWEAKAGKFGTFVLFLALGFGLVGFAAKGVIKFFIAGSQ